MSFFKKKTSKIKKPPKDKAAEQSKLSKEISEMDKERHLDMQLEELTARLNIPESENTAPPEDLPLNVAEATPIEEDFIAKSLKEFSAPSFTAKVRTGVKNIDVTTESETTEPVNTGPSPTEPVIIEPAPEIDLPDVSRDAGLTRSGRLDMSEMRVDVAKISADIQSGEELYRRALQRVEGLMGFVEKAEIDFSVLNRLEPENRRLKAKLRTANGERDTLKSKLDISMANLQDHQERLDEKTKQYEVARGKLATAANTLQEYKRLLKATKNDAERFSISLERHKTALGVESTENKVLREKISELSSGLETRQAEYLEASKIIESLKNDCDDFREQAETYRTEAQDLRITLNTAKRQNNAMKGEMLSLHEDIKTFKTEYEFHVITREDQVTDLETQIADLTQTVSRKSDLAHEATQELADIRKTRNEQDIERDRLEKQLALAKAEARDMGIAADARNADKLTALEAEIRDLKNEISLHTEANHQVSKAMSDAERQIIALQEERDRLSVRLDDANKEIKSSAKNNLAEKLQANILSLSDQLKIKDDIVRGAAIDMSRLTQERDAQRAENKRLEDLVDSQKFQLEAAQKALSESKINQTELDQKYHDIAAALTINKTRRRAENPSQSPDIAPDISDEITDLSGKDIENRILDYKFGIRKDIV